MRPVFIGAGIALFLLVSMLFVLNNYYSSSKQDTPEQILRAKDNEPPYGPDDVVYGPRIVLKPSPPTIIVAPRTVVERPIVRPRPIIKRRPKPIIVRKKAKPAPKRPVQSKKKKFNKSQVFVPYVYGNGRSIIPEGIDARFRRSDVK